MHSIHWRVGLVYAGMAMLSLILLSWYLIGAAADPSIFPLPNIAAVTVVIAVVLGLVGALYAATHVTRPLRELTRVVRQLAEGDLDRRARVGSNDEIGDLAGALNQMAAGLKGTLEGLSGEHLKSAAILQAMADGIVITNGDGDVSLINSAAERILQTTRHRALGHSIIEVSRDHNLAQLVRDCLSAPEGSAHLTRPLEIGSPRRSLQAVATLIRQTGQQKGPKEVLLVLQDVTEIKRLEAVRREFVANISHELRTPIATIKAIVETLQEGALDDPPAAQHFLGKMDVEVDGLAQMVRELLELSRIESGQTPLRIEPLDVEPLVRRSVERLRTQADRAGVALEVEIHPGLPRVLADGERIEQVLINLAHNAIKFTPSGGRIVVSSEPLKGQVGLSVADDGIGIPAQDIPRIFERFYKADKSRSTGGTGLGLAVAKHIVQAHGGRIWVESQEEKGSKFTFTLPVEPAG